MGEPDLRIDPLTGAHVIVTPWRQHRPNLPDGRCPFCPGGLEALSPMTCDFSRIAGRVCPQAVPKWSCIARSTTRRSRRWTRRGARVIELWSARTAALGARPDVDYVLVFENKGRLIGATMDHPHSQILGFGLVPPVPGTELAQPTCDLCRDPDDEAGCNTALRVAGHGAVGALVAV